MKYIKEFGKRLKLLIKEENISPEQLGKKSGVDKSRIYKYIDEYIDDNIDTKTSTIIKLSNSLNTSVSYLIGETDVRNADDTALGKRFNIDGQVIENLEKIKKINEKYENKYSDLLAELLTSPELYNNLVESIDTLLKYKENGSVRSELDKKMIFKNLTITELVRAEVIGSIFYEYNRYVEKKEDEYGYSHLTKRDLEVKARRLRSEAYRLEKEKDKLPD